MPDEPTDQAAPSVGYLNLLRLRDPRRLAIASIPADFADWLDYAAVVALLVFVWGEGPLVLAFFALALTLPYVAIGPFLAVLVDRTPLRTVLVASNLGRAAATFGLLFAGDTVALLMIVFVRSSIDSAFTPARQAAIQATTPKALLQAANGLHQAINQISKISGPALGGILLAVIPAQTVFGINAVLSVVAAGIAATIVVDRSSIDLPDREESGLRAALAGFAEFGRNRLLRTALIFVAAGFFAVFLYDALIALLAQEYGFDETVFGLSIATSGLGGLVGALIAGKISKVTPLTLMSLAAILGGLVAVLLGASALLAWPVPVVAFLLALAVAGGSVGLVTVPYRTIIQTETTPDRIARVYAAGEAVTVAAMMSAPFIGAAIAGRLGTGAAFVAGGVLMLLLAIVMLLRRSS